MSQSKLHAEALMPDTQAAACFQTAADRLIRHFFLISLPHALM